MYSQASAFNIVTHPNRRRRTGVTVCVCMVLKKHTLTIVVIRRSSFSEDGLQ